MWRSVPHSPAPVTAMRAWPGPGSGVGTSTTLQLGGVGRQSSRGEHHEAGPVIRSASQGTTGDGTNRGRAAWLGPIWVMPGRPLNTS